jgi:hypothetical protein
MITGIYAHINGITYTKAGTFVTKDTGLLDVLLDRLYMAASFEEFQKNYIQIVYIGDNQFAIYIASDKYSICYSSIISSYNEYCRENVYKDDMKDEENE